jgi:hypothetical protein
MDVRHYTCRHLPTTTWRATGRPTDSAGGATTGTHHPTRTSLGFVCLCRASVLLAAAVLICTYPRAQAHVKDIHASAAVAGAGLHTVGPAATSAARPRTRARLGQTNEGALIPPGTPPTSASDDSWKGMPKQLVTSRIPPETEPSSVPVQHSGRRAGLSGAATAHRPTLAPRVTHR